MKKTGFPPTLAATKRLDPVRVSAWADLSLANFSSRGVHAHNHNSCGIGRHPFSYHWTVQCMFSASSFGQRVTWW